MEFVAIGVRTANANPFSLCQIAVSSIGETNSKSDFETLLYTDTSFDKELVRQHFINARSVRHAPIFEAIFPEIEKALEGRTALVFGPSVQFAMEELSYRINRRMPECRWMDLRGILAKVIDSDDDDVEKINPFELALRFGVKVERKCPYRWDAADEVEVIQQLFVHFVKLLKKGQKISHGTATEAAQ